MKEYYREKKIPSWCHRCIWIGFLRTKTKRSAQFVVAPFSSVAADIKTQPLLQFSRCFFHQSYHNWFISTYALYYATLNYYYRGVAHSNNIWILMNAFTICIVTILYINIYVCVCVCMTFNYSFKSKLVVIDTESTDWIALSCVEIRVPATHSRSLCFNSFVNHAHASYSTGSNSF